MPISKPPCKPSFTAVIVAKDEHVHYRRDGEAWTLCGRMTLSPVSESNQQWWAQQSLCGTCYTRMAERHDKAPDDQDG